MYYDYHMHSNFSGDSQTPMEDMVKKSIDLGLKEICFTDHVDYDIISNVPFETDYISYLKSIDNLKDKFKNQIMRWRLMLYKRGCMSEMYYGTNWLMRIILMR